MLPPSQTAFSPTDMAADLQSLDGADSATAAFTGAIAVAATMVPAAATNSASPLVPAMPASENAPPQKRQRRPSVRLGEIGDQATTLSHESQGRRPKPSWRIPREKDPSKPHKARSLTHLVNGNNTDDSTFDFRLQKTKPKRGAEIGIGTVTKKARSNWAHYRNDEIAENNPGEREFEEDDEGQLEAEDETYHHRDFEPVSDSPVKDLSPFQSGGDATATDSRERKVGSEGVRSWLIELGLSRYAPVFEIHEVDEEVLPLLTLEDLKDMGINAVGSRRKMYSAIQKLNRGFSRVE